MQERVGKLPRASYDFVDYETVAVVIHNDECVITRSNIDNFTTESAYP